MSQIEQTCNLSASFASPAPKHSLLAELSSSGTLSTEDSFEQQK
jgi:hypothetical protein